MQSHTHSYLKELSPASEKDLRMYRNIQALMVSSLLEKSRRRTLLVTFPPCWTLLGSCCQLACFNNGSQVIRLLSHTLFTWRTGRPLVLILAIYPLKSKDCLTIIQLDYSTLLQEAEMKFTSRISTVPTAFPEVFFVMQSGQWFTLLSLLVSLLHGYQRGEVSLIVGQDQRGAVTAARRHLQRQIEPSKRDGSERCKFS